MGCSPPLPSPTLPSPPSLIPHPHVVFVRAFVGVCSAWAVGGVVIMESVLCDLWAGLQNANQELCERRRGHGLRTARDSDQTLQHSSVPWLVPSPFTWHTRSLSLSLPLCLFKHDFLFLLHLNHKTYFQCSRIYIHKHSHFVSFHYSSCTNQTCMSSCKKKMWTEAAFMSNHTDWREKKQNVSILKF